MGEQRPAFGRRAFLKAALGLGGGLLGAGCAGAPQPPAPTATPVRTLEYLGWEGYDLQREAQAWTEANGVTLNTTYIGHNDDVPARFLSSGPGRFDVGSVASRSLPAMIEQDMLQPLEAERLPNFRAVYPALREAGWARRGAEQYALPAYFGFDAISYNADRIERPAAWEALRDPRYQGKVGLYDSLGVMTFIGILLGLGGDAGAYTRAHLDEIRAWGKGWKGNGGALLRTYGEMAERLASGDLWLAAPGWEYVTVRGAQLGAPLAHTLPAGPAKCWCDAYVLFAEAPNADTAYDWLDNAFAPEVMAASSQSLSSLVANPEAVPLLPAAHRAAMGYADVPAQLERAEFSFFPPEVQADPERIALSDLLVAWEEVKSA